MSLHDDLAQLADDRQRPAARARLERLRPQDAPALVAALQADRLGGVGASEILRLLAVLAVPETLPAVLAAIEDPRTNVRWAALSAAAAFPGTAATDALAARLDDADRDTAKHAASLLGDRGDEAAVPALSRALRDADAGMRYSAARALAEIGGGAAHAALAAHRERETDPDVLALIP